MCEIICAAIDSGQLRKEDIQMEFEQKEFHSVVAKERKQVQITIDQDCNVPDTKADIDRMIQTKGKVNLAETELMVDQVRMKGEFVFQGLYATTDTKTFLEALDLALPFEEFIRMEGAVPTDYMKVEYVIDDINVRLINSRKLSIRILLTLSLQLNEEMKEEGIIDILDEDVSLFKKEIQVTDVIVNKKDVARIKEELVLPANKSNIYQILWEQISLEDVQGKLGNAKIEIQGDMNVFVLYIGEDDQTPVQYVRWTIPINTEIECLECEPGMIGKVNISLGSEELEIRPDMDGEERIILLEGILDCNIKIYEDRNLSYVFDAYTRKCVLTPIYKEVMFETLLGKNKATMKLEDQFQLEENQGNMLQVLSVRGNCNIDEQERKENGIEVEGVVISSVLFLTTDDMLPVASADYVQPFTYLIEAKSLDENVDYQLDIGLDRILATPVEGNKIELKARVVFDLISFCKKNEKVMVDVKEEPLDYEYLQKLPGIVGYRVKPGDTLWSIAKKFYTTVDGIREQNDIKEEIKPGDKIIIVKEIQ